MVKIELYGFYVAYLYENSSLADKLSVWRDSNESRGFVLPFGA